MKHGPETVIGDPPSNDPRLGEILLGSTSSKQQCGIFYITDISVAVCLCHNHNYVERLHVALPLTTNYITTAT